MLEAGLEFPSSARTLVIKAFLELPGLLRPNLMKIGEDEAGTMIRDEEKFLSIMAERNTGFFFEGSGLCYDVGFAGPNGMTCHCWLDIDVTLIKTFLIHMAAAKPIFGYADAGEERERWNRINTTQGINSIESWVGRNPQKYVPGLYWWTLLPTALAEQHRVSLAAVEKVALEHIRIEGGQNLFRFYEKPDDWRSASAVNALRASQPGIFDVEKVRPLATAAKTFLDLCAVTKLWD